METLFRCVTGSRMYGTQTPNSDTDYKYVGLPDLDELLVGTGLKNKSTTTKVGKGKNSSDDVDEEVIPLQVLARDFLQGQTYALELVFAALSDVDSAVYGPKAGMFIEFCTELSLMFLTSNMKSMMGFALGQAHKYGVKGTRLASIEKFLGQLEREVQKDWGPIRPKMSELESWVNANADKYLFIDDYKGPNGSDEKCVSLIGKIYPFAFDVQYVYEQVEKLYDSYGDRAHKAKTSDGNDWKAISHALRICYQAKEILESGSLTFPLKEPHRTYVTDIKLGKVSQEEALDAIAEMMEKVNALQEQSKLPELSHELQNKFKAWLILWMRKFYELA